MAGTEYPVPLHRFPVFGRRRNRDGHQRTSGWRLWIYSLRLCSAGRWKCAGGRLLCQCRKRDLVSGLCKLDRVDGSAAFERGGIGDRERLPGVCGEGISESSGGRTGSAAGLLRAAGSAVRAGSYRFCGTGCAGRTYLQYGSGTGSGGAGFCGVLFL